MAIEALLPLAGTMISGALNYYGQSQANEQNIKFQQDTNKQNLDYQRYITELQRGWALSDWDKMNAYNHPAQQMQRLREAGLNPNLVYGNGSATSTAAMVKSTGAESPKLASPHMAPLSFPDFGGPLSEMYRIDQITAQTDNLKAQNAILQKEAVLKDIRIAHDAPYSAAAGQLADLSIKRAQLDNELKLQSSKQIVQNMDYKPKEFELHKQSSAVDQLLKMAQTDQARQAILNAAKDGSLKDYQLQLRNIGLQESDPWYFRMLYKMMMAVPDGNPHGR